MTAMLEEIEAQVKADYEKRLRFLGRISIDARELRKNAITYLGILGRLRKANVYMDINTCLSLAVKISAVKLYIQDATRVMQQLEGEVYALERQAKIQGKLQ